VATLSTSLFRVRAVSQASAHSYAGVSQHIWRQPAGTISQRGEQAGDDGNASLAMQLKVMTATQKRRSPVHVAGVEQEKRQMSLPPRGGPNTCQHECRERGRSPQTGITIGEAHQGIIISLDNSDDLGKHHGKGADL